MIVTCYCSPNMKQNECDYCFAKRLIRDMLANNNPNIHLTEKDFDRVFEHYNISLPARLNMLTEIDSHEHSR